MLCCNDMDRTNLVYLKRVPTLRWWSLWALLEPSALKGACSVLTGGKLVRAYLSELNQRVVHCRSSFICFEEA